MDPNDVNDMANLGKMIFEALPDEAKNNLVLPASKELGKGAGSLGFIASYPFHSLALTLNSKLREKEIQLELETNKKIDELKKKNMYSDERAGLAVKAIEMSKYSLDSDTLRTFFSELIASSLNKSQMNRVSPNFATILSNLTENDALFLRRIKREYGNVSFPITSIEWEKPDGNFHTHKKNLTIWKNGKFTENQESIDALQSFGLIQIDRGVKGTSGNYPNLYEAIEKSPEFLIAKLGMIAVNQGYEKISHRDELANITTLGQSFISTVVV